MNTRFRSVVLAGLFALSAAGCGGSKEQEMDFTPKTSAPEGAADVLRPPEENGPPQTDQR